jgi:hypothetical protein
MEGEQQKDERFISILKELETLKEDFVVRKIKGYQKATRLARLRFRVAGVLIIVLSACLPLLSTLREGIWISIVLPIVALTIAGLSGLSAFFHWESNWRGFSQTRFMLEYQLKMWELRIIEAKYEMDPQKAVEIAMQATKQLLDETRSVTSDESEEFFKRAQLPKVAP